MKTFAGGIKFIFFSQQVALEPRSGAYYISTIHFFDEFQKMESESIFEQIDRFHL